MTASFPTDVAVSDELNAVLPSGVSLCHQTYGDPVNEPLLLVMGLAGPMTWWDAHLCAELARLGFFVVRYDSRDVGRSSRAQGRVTRSMLVRAFTGVLQEAPYSLSDLADDAIALLDHLGLDRAHVMGVSMGGMIAQTLAIEHPDRIISLVSVMSTTGRRTVGWQDPRLLPALIARRARDRSAYIASSARMWDMIGSPGFPEDGNARLEEKAGTTWDRGISGSGVLRQMMAILTQPDRTAALRGLDVPAAVMHGLADRMVHVSGGRATAAAIPGAELVLVPGMGHDLPPALFDDIAALVRRTADRA